MQKRKIETPAAGSRVVEFYQLEQLMAADMLGADFLDIEVSRGLSVPVVVSSRTLSSYIETETFGDV